MSRFGRSDPSLAVETEVSELVAAGHSRIDTTMQVIERIGTEAREATTVVLVEGLSDQIAVEIIAGRDGRALPADGTFVVPTGGAMSAFAAASRRPASTGAIRRRRWGHSASTRASTISKRR